MFNRSGQQIIWKKKTGLNGYVYDFSVDNDATSVDDIKDIHKYLMKKNNMIWQICTHMSKRQELQSNI